MFSSPLSCALTTQCVALPAAADMKMCYVIQPQQMMN